MTGKCNKIYRLMNLSADDAISEKDNRKLNDHLAVCEKCRDEFNSLKYVISLAKEVEEKDPPTDFKMSVISHIRRLDFEKKDKQSRTVMKYVWRAAPMAAACLAVVFIAYMLSGNGILAGRMNDTALSADAQLENTVASVLGDSQKSMGVTGNIYIFDMTIDSSDPDTLKNEINTIINEIVKTAGDESFSEAAPANGTNEIIAEVTPEQGKAILERIKQTYTDFTITERDADVAGMIRIIINKK